MIVNCVFEIWPREQSQIFQALPNMATVYGDGCMGMDVNQIFVVIIFKYTYKYQIILLYTCELCYFPIISKFKSDIKNERSSLNTVQEQMAHCQWMGEATAFCITLKARPEDAIL